MKRPIILFTFLLFASLQAHAQTIEKINERLGFSKPSISKEARIDLTAGDVDKALIDYSEAVTRARESRSAAYGVDGELLAEYAYTLALHHDFEASFMYIDRARMVGAKHGDFYAAQILTLMSYTEAAKQMMTQAEIPDWIANHYQNLTQKHISSFSINRDAPKEALKRANQLAANHQTIQAIALFEELIKLHPDAYILYIDYSTVWENKGNKEYASTLLSKGIELMPDNLSESESKKTFSSHLSMLNNANTTPEKPEWIKKAIGDETPRFMTYIGASAARKAFFLNGRMGLYSSNKFSTAINMGLGLAGESFSGNIGISAYKNWGAFFAGIGISDQFSKGSNTLGLSPTIGLSFLDKSQSSSLDVSLSGFIPIFSKSPFSYSISVGKTIYFNWKGGKK